MTREWLVRLALRAYPRQVAAQRGAEMFAMALEAGATSKPEFGRELTSLIVGGVRERALVTAQPGRRRLAADALRQALTIYLAVFVWTLFTIAPRIFHLTAEEVLGAGLLCGLLGLLLAGFDRLVGVIGVCLLSIVGVLAFISVHDAVGRLGIVIELPPVLILFVASIVMPRKTPRRPWRLAWLLPLAVSAWLLSAHAGARIDETAYEEIALALVSLVGLVRLPYDPRLALACALLWTNDALNWTFNRISFQSESHTAFPFTTIQWLVICLAPPVLALASVRLIRMRRGPAT